MRYRRITVNPAQMGSTPCIRVAAIVEMVAEDMSQQGILQAYPDLKPENIHEVLHYATKRYASR